MRFQGKVLCDWCGSAVAGKKTQVKINTGKLKGVYCDKHCKAAKKKYGP